jgi:hypothetical protein
MERDKEMRDSQHATAQTVDRFLRAEALPKERIGLVRHLLARCPECLRTTGESSEDSAFGARRRRGEPIPDAAYEDVFSRVERRTGKVAQRLAEERAQSAHLWQVLRDATPEQRRIRVHNDRRFHSWGFCEHLIAESREAGRQAPGRALELAELAVEAAQRLDGRRYGAERVADLRALAWDALANARRWLADFPGAQQALGCARQEIGRGTSDLLIEAMVTSSEAALAIDQGRLEGLEEPLDRAIRTFRRVGDSYLEGRALLLKAVAVGPADPERGEALLRQALRRIEKAAPGRSARIVERLAPLLQPWGGEAVRRRSRA